jgi:molybdopterin synthase catalytic subunit
MARLTREPIDAAGLQDEARRPDCGAVVAFLGTSRNHHQGRDVLRLVYDAYEPMALEALGAIERGAVERHDIVSCTIVHRLGEVPMSEASVAVIVAAAHRGPAFDASRWAMDELKRTVPIWKKELFADGGEDWVEGRRLER